MPFRRQQRLQDNTTDNTNNFAVVVAAGIPELPICSCTG
jgi:hypothetical protein